MTLLRLITTTSKGTHCSFERLPIYVNVLMLGSVNITLRYLIGQGVERKNTRLLLQKNMNNLDRFVIM